MLLYSIVLLLCKGGSSFDSIIGLEHCGVGSWMCVLLHVALSYLYSKSIAMKQYQLDLEKESLRMVFTS